MHAKAPSSIACKKCGGSMHGPHFDKIGEGSGETLKYICSCGYVAHRPTVDSEVRK